MGREACVVRLRARWADLGRGAVAGAPGAPAEAVRGAGRHAAAVRGGRRLPVGPPPVGAPAHSLLFVLLLLLAAFAWRGSAGSALSLLALGSLVHLAMDRLWTDLDMLLWPLLGWRPERQDVSGWAGEKLGAL